MSPATPPTPERPSTAVVWIHAVRPRTLPAAAAPVLIGSGVAAFHDAFALLPALAALIGALLIQVATNLANDYYDHERGSDSAARVGPTRVTQAGWLDPGAVWTGVLVTLFAALLVGVYLVFVGGWPVVAIGLASILCAVIYTGGPWPLAYHGLGDVFVFLFFGLVAVGGTYWVQALDLTADPILAGAGVGALSTAILVVNNLRDIPTDAAAGKRTLAVRIGPAATRAEYVAMLAVGAAVPVVGVNVLGWPVATLAASAAVVLAVFPLRRVLSFAQPADLLPALGETARVVALYGIALGGAFVWG